MLIEKGIYLEIGINLCGGVAPRILRNRQETAGFREQSFTTAAIALAQHRDSAL